MDLLHAYWRMDYVRSGSGTSEDRENPFRELPHLGDDRRALIVHRGTHHFLVLNKYPYNPGHLLVVPYAEVAELAELEPEARLELMDLIVRAQEVLKATLQPDGFNIGFNLGKLSGAGIPSHLHGHIVPRWSGDANFISVIGETRTLPQALDQTWDILTEAFRHA